MNKLILLFLLVSSPAFGTANATTSKQEVDKIEAELNRKLKQRIKQELIKDAKPKQR